MWPRRIRLGLAWIIGLYLAQMYVNMGWVKFDPGGFWTAAFVRWGYPEWFRILIGVLEVGGGIALVIPWIASYAGVTLAVVMAGAGITRFRDGNMVDVAWIALYFVACLWIAFEWRGWRLGGRRGKPAPAAISGSAPAGGRPSRRAT